MRIPVKPNIPFDSARLTIPGLFIVIEFERINLDARNIEIETALIINANNLYNPFKYI